MINFLFLGRGNSSFDEGDHGTPVEETNLQYLIIIKNTHTLLLQGNNETITDVRIIRLEIERNRFTPEWNFNNFCRTFQFNF